MKDVQKIKGLMSQVEILKGDAESIYIDIGNKIK